MKETFDNLTEWFGNAKERNMVVIDQKNAYIAWHDMKSATAPKPDFRAKKGEFDKTRQYG